MTDKPTARSTTPYRRTTRSPTAPRELPVQRDVQAWVRKGRKPGHLRHPRLGDSASATFDDLVFLTASASRYPLEGYRESARRDLCSSSRNAKRPRSSHHYHPDNHRRHELRFSFGEREEALGRGLSCRYLYHDGRRRDDGRGARSPRCWSTMSALAYGFNPRLRRADAVEVVIGPGGQACRRGMLLGAEYQRARRLHDDLPAGIDQRSASRHAGLDRPRRSDHKDRGAARDNGLGRSSIYVRSGRPSRE